MGLPAPNPDHREQGSILGTAVDGYFAVPLSCLRVDTITSFTIYLRNPPDGNRYVFYRESNLLFSDRHHCKLEENGVTHIYIAAADRKLYLRYLEAHIDEILQDPKLSSAEKNEIHYACATKLAEDLFNDPRSGENVKRARRMVDATVHHILQEAGRLSALIDVMSFDYYTYTHSVNVCVLGVALGHRIGLTPEELEALGVGLLLHDMGKSEIDVAVLNKHGPLSDEEWELMKTHPQLGVDIFKHSPLVGPVALTVILQHHEKCTGCGYPAGLRGTEIHRFAKIAALVDVFDALTTERAYRGALQSFTAIQVMKNEMEVDFDPDLFRQFIQLLGA